MKIPHALPPVSRGRDSAKRMYSFNVEMTKLSKQASDQIGSEGLEIILENLVRMIGADFGETETVELPVHVVKQTNLYAVATISRLLWEMYKLENKIGRRIEGVKDEE